MSMVKIVSYFEPPDGGNAMGYNPDNTINNVPNAQIWAGSRGSSQATANGPVKDSLQDFGTAPPGRLAPLGLADYPVKSMTRSATRTGGGARLAPLGLADYPVESTSSARAA